MLYTPVKVSISQDQIDKLQSSLKSTDAAHLPLSIKIRLRDSNNEHILLLTRAQIARMERMKAKGRRTSITIRFSKRQVEKNLVHRGGFLGLLAGLAARVLPALAKGLATGLASGAAEKMLNGGGDGLYLFRSVHCIKVDPVEGNGLYLYPHTSSHGSYGDGLYLKRGNTVHRGEGLILGKNSPFKNIPILGWIL